MWTGVKVELDEIPTKGSGISTGTDRGLTVWVKRLSEGLCRETPGCPERLSEPDVQLRTETVV